MPGSRDQGQAQGGVFPGERGAVDFGEAGICWEPKGGWAVFSLSREKERKTTLSIALKIEQRAGQAVARRGRAFLGLSPALAGLVWQKGS